MKVRATKDGHYGGYFRHGPIDSEQGRTPGEVFEIDEKPFAQRDEHGNPVQEMEPTGQVDEKGIKTFKLSWVMEHGKVKKDAQGQPVPKIKMTTFYSPEWMEPVPEDTEVTYDYPPIASLRDLDVYRVKKQKPGKTVALPAETAAAAGIEVAESVI